MDSLPYIGKGQRCKTPVRVILTPENLRTLESPSPAIRFARHACQWQARCPQCPDPGHWIWLLPVHGTYHPGKVCNARCMGATGPACECSCAGSNHGGSHTL